MADEPVSALDVSIQAQVVNLLEDLQEELDLTYVMIAHDLSVVRHVSDRVAVMYLGKIVEMGDRDDLYEPPEAPLHGRDAVRRPGARHRTPAAAASGSGSQGDVPSPINPPPGCRFHTRCWKAQDICRTEEPPLLQITSGPAATSRPHGRLPLPRRAGGVPELSRPPLTGRMTAAARGYAAGEAHRRQPPRDECDG